LAGLFLQVCGFAIMVTIVTLYGDRVPGARAEVTLYVVSLPFLYPYVMIAIKRIHDLNESGRNVLLLFVPVVGSLVSVYLLFAGGTKGVNQYGPPPKLRRT